MGLHGTWTYTVSLTVSNGKSEDTETKVDYIEVFEVIVLDADFEAAPTAGFVPLTVNFTDLSTGGPESWLWDFGDGETSTLQNPGHDYFTFGIYTVSLTVFRGEDENTEVKEGYIEVYQTQNGDWSQQHVCLDNTPEAELMIRAGDIDNLGFGWANGFDPFSGQSTSSHGFPWTPDPDDTGGTDRIMVVTSFVGSGYPCGTDGYTSYTSRPENFPEPIIIDLCPLSQGEITSAAMQIFVDDIQPVSFCSEFTVKLNGQTFTPLQTFINHLNQTGPIGRMLTVRIPDELLYLLEGDQLELEIDDFTTHAGDGFAIDFVKLLINEGVLAHSGSIDGNVYDSETGLPIMDAEVEASFWETALTISDGSYNIAEVPAGLVYIECRKAGYYTETKLANLSSGNSYTANFWLDPALTADFSATPLSGDAPLEVNFTDLSAGDPTSYEWDFENDGTIDSYDPNPVWTYDEEGVYSVKLTIYDNKSSSIEIKENYITVESSVYPFTPVWENPFNPMTFYITGATFAGVDLQAGDEIGIFDVDPITSEEICVGTGTLTQPLVAGEYLEVIASMDDGINPEQANGFTPGNSFIFMLYSQTSGVAENVEYAFPYPGYDEVFASQGSTIVNLSTSFGLNSDFTADVTSGIAPLTVNFTDLSTGGPTTWQWDFQNDGTIDSDDQNPEWIYNEPGTYTVSLTVSNAKK